MAIVAHADPENFMVDEFTFTRPANWKWVSDDSRSSKGNLLNIVGANSNEGAVVYFWKFKQGGGSPENRTKAWQAYFKETRDDLHIRSTTKKAGAFEITYIEMDGTAVRAPHPDYSLIGATIKVKDGHVAIRMSGATKVVESSKVAFKEMIERALQEKESQ